jgi:hypothetical protein
MTVSFLAGRAYQPRHAAPPGLFWRSLLSRNQAAAAVEWPRHPPDAGMTSNPSSGSAARQSAQSRTPDGRQLR